MLVQYRFAEVSTALRRSHVRWLEIHLPSPGLFGIPARHAHPPRRARCCGVAGKACLAILNSGLCLVPIEAAASGRSRSPSSPPRASEKAESDLVDILRHRTAVVIVGSGDIFYPCTVVGWRRSTTGTGEKKLVRLQRRYNSVVRPSYHQPRFHSLLPVTHRRFLIKLLMLLSTASSSVSLSRRT